MARVGVGLGRRLARRLRALLPGERRRRQYPATRAAVEPRWLREQRDPAGPGAGGRPLIGWPTRGISFARPRGPLRRPAARGMAAPAVTAAGVHVHRGA